MSIRTNSSCNTFKLKPLPSGYSHKDKFKVTSWQGTNPDSNGNYFWTDGTNIYISDYTDEYVLNGSTWEAKVWTGIPDVSMIGWGIWTDGTNIYHTNGDTQILRNGAWEDIFDGQWFAANCFWTDGTDIYYSYKSYSTGQEHKILNKDTLTWEDKTCTFPNDFQGQYIWSDGTNIYYSNGTSTHYVLNGDTWGQKAWNGLTTFSGQDIWTDGTNIYHSSGSNQFVLDKDTSTWTAITWEGLATPSPTYLWTDGTNIYHSNNGSHYILVPPTSALYTRQNGAWVRTGAVTNAD